ncbi:hypothetical protein CDAR_310941 [Caerostris darwini]|uniref:peptide-methionine (S)-S-oxide reductase n=1 Tax=Caerostris darwini TaxID=1538125 RepID=A0AAV4WUG1_9ARAC|nr:hypothetical protein CDAR_310941 [Caerostris darwini]
MLSLGANPGFCRPGSGTAEGLDPAPIYPKVNDHTEAVEVTFDPSVLSYEDLLSLFWQFHDPCSCSKRQYMSAIFHTSDRQKQMAQDSKKRHEIQLGKSVTTQIQPLDVFHEAEDYHQKYFLRIYHRTFYHGLPKQDPLKSTRDARLNGYLSGHRSLEDMQNDEHISDLTDEQLLYVKRHMAGEEKAPTVEPFIRTVTTVGWNFIKKTMEHSYNNFTFSSELGNKIPFLHLSAGQSP